MNKEQTKFAEKIEEVIKKSGKKLLELINLRQEERFLEQRKEELRNIIIEKGRILEQKHDLKFLELTLTIAELEKINYQEKIEHYLKELKKKRQKKQ